MPYLAQVGFDPPLTCAVLPIRSLQTWQESWGSRKYLYFGFCFKGVSYLVTGIMQQEFQRGAQAWVFPGDFQCVFFLRSVNTFYK